MNGLFWIFEINDLIKLHFTKKNYSRIAMCLQTNKKCFGSKIKNKFLCWLMFFIPSINDEINLFDILLQSINRRVILLNLLGHCENIFFVKTVNLAKLNVIKGPWSILKKSRLHYDYRSCALSLSIQWIRSYQTLCYQIKSRGYVLFQPNYQLILTYNGRCSLDRREFRSQSNVLLLSLMSCIKKPKARVKV